MHTVSAASFAEAVREGVAILRFQDQQVERACREARHRIIAGYSVPVVNTLLFASEIGEALCRDFPGSPFAATYYDDRTAERVWGLRSPRFDVGRVAAACGGGGHPRASGFRSSTDNLVMVDGALRPMSAVEVRPA